MKLSIVRNSVLVLIFSVWAIGCDSADPDTGSTARVSLNLVATASAPAAKSGSAVPEITSAKILLRTIQFHRRDDESEEGEEYRTEPIVAELNLDGTPVPFTLSEVPLGTYHKVSFRIHKPEEGEMDFPEFYDGPGGNDRHSVLVSGILDLEPFQYKSSKAMHQQVDFEEDLVIDDALAETDVTLLVDVSEWFVSDSGETLDPTDTHAANTSAIDKSIRESFRIFKDHDKNGQPDS